MPIVRSNEPISNWQEGDFVQGFALLNRREQRQDRNGRDYLDVELTDATGSIGGKVWPDSPAIKGRYAEKDFVAFKGTVRLYRDQLQINVDHCRQVNEQDRQEGFDEALLIPSTPEDIDDLERRLSAIYPGALERPETRRLVAEAQRRYGAQLRVHPAAKNIHHAYRGGMLEHVVTMAELALKVCDQYRELDRDLVLLGVYFHDLGKLRELGAMPANDYTLEGQLVGHIVIGQEMLLECAAAVADFPAELLLHLQHLIASHHGRREFGSPTEPATPEAFALHYIDDLDSKLNQLRHHRLSGAEGMHYVRALGRSVYLDRPAAPPTSDES
jgi:3'-5' exoribonuclease